MIFLFQYFMFSLRFMPFPTFKNKILVYKIPRGGGGVFNKFVCLKKNSFSFHFAFYAIFNIKKNKIGKY